MERLNKFFFFVIFHGEEGGVKKKPTVQDMEMAEFTHSNGGQGWLRKGRYRCEEGTLKRESRYVDECHF